MDSLKIKPSKYTPEIIFDETNNTLTIKGESYPENTMEFYSPVFNWIKTFLAQPEMPMLTVNFDMIYFNSSSSKTLINMFDLFDNAVKEGKKIQANWIYETDDEDNLEMGEEFAEDLESLKLNLVEKAADE